MVEPKLEVGKLVADVGVVRTACAEVTSEAIEDATEAAEDNAAVIDGKSDEGAVCATD